VHEFLRSIGKSSVARPMAALALSYLVLGWPILAWWTGKYFKGDNESTYQLVLFAALVAIWAAALALVGGGSLAKRALLGASVGYLAGVVAYAVADYSLFSASSSVGEWAETRLSLLNVLMMGIALLPWVIGAAAGTLDSLLQSLADQP
jgi:hypothetical protein